MVLVLFGHGKPAHLQRDIGKTDRGQILMDLCHGILPVQQRPPPAGNENTVQVKKICQDRESRQTGPGPLNDLALHGALEKRCGLGRDQGEKNASVSGFRIQVLQVQVKEVGANVGCRV